MSHTPAAFLILAALACSGPRTAEAHETARNASYSLELVDESGRELPTFHHRGRTYVLGTRGDRYLLRIHNRTGSRIEVVASVDGRDVVDGRPASASKPGYVVEAWGQVVIDGFRLSHDAVAAFRFSAVDASYAARMGDARDVGVVGVAVFREAPPPPPAVVPDRELQDAPGKAAPRAEGEKKERSGLGTGFGERRESRVVEVAFERASASPAAVLSLRYDDRDGLVAVGIDVDGSRLAAHERWLRETAEPFRGDAFAAPPPGWNGR